MAKLRKELKERGSAVFSSSSGVDERDLDRERQKFAKETEKFKEKEREKEKQWEAERDEWDVERDRFKTKEKELEKKLKKLAADLASAEAELAEERKGKETAEGNLRVLTRKLALAEEEKSAALTKTSSMTSSSPTLKKSFNSPETDAERALREAKYDICEYL